MLKSFLIFLRGLLMGIADAVPGVSGGTIALITGIYTQLIHGISEVDFSLLLKGKFKPFLQKVNFKFFIPLGFGIAIGLFFFSKLIDYLLNNQAALTFAFFFGLILASAVLLFKMVGKLTLGKMFFAVLGFLFAYVISGPSILGLGHSLPIIFGAGVIAISAMILPGISGAFLLLLLNQYQYILSSLHSFNLAVIGTFGLGAFVGLFSFSKLLNYLLRKFKNLMLAFLTGLMLGSLRVPIREVNGSSGMDIFVLFIGAFGFLLVFGMERFFKKK